MSAPAGRVAISLTSDERAALKQLARRRSEPEATTAARLVRAGLTEDGACLERPPARRRGPDGDANSAGPVVDREAAIAMLTERYPVELLRPRMSMSDDVLLLERLAALARWRDQLDADAPAEPRAELAFHAELVAVSRWLDERQRQRR